MFQHAPNNRHNQLEEFALQLSLASSSVTFSNPPDKKNGVYESFLLILHRLVLYIWTIVYNLEVTPLISVSNDIGAFCTHFLRNFLDCPKIVHELDISTVSKTT